MARKILSDLLSIDEARGLFHDLKIRSHAVTSTLDGSLGHFLAEDVVSEIHVPSFDKSLKDGYAIRRQDLEGVLGTKDLRLLGMSSVGRKCPYCVGRDEAVEVATGAPIPAGADCVVMVEDTELHGDHVRLRTPVSVDGNILSFGGDVSKGQIVLEKGRRIGPREIGVLASVGRVFVDIVSMRVGVISTGNELLVPGSPLEDGMIYDTNSHSLCASIRECGVDAVCYGIVKDERDVVSLVLEKAVGECDLVLTSGSTSAGPDDFMYELIEEKGTVLAHGLNFKPGKPVIVGLVGDVPVIGLPGHPTSSMTVFYEFLRPLIRSWAGATVEKKRSVSATMGEDVVSGTRHELLAVKLEGGKVFSASRSSAAITTLVYADGFVEIPADIEVLEEGSVVEVTLFNESCI